MFDEISKMLQYIQANRAMYANDVRVHLILFFAVLLASVAIGAPLGVINARKPLFSAIAMNVFSALKMIPSVALLLLFLPVLGAGLVPAFIALVLHGVPTILISTYTGYREVNAAALESARAMGLSRREIFWKVETPLALPVLFAGVRTCTVDVIASATLAAYIGAGGLGEFVVMGLSQSENTIMFVGSFSIALLSLAVDFLLFGLEKLLIRYKI
jgi:osmoprotectant transport system permease protein